MTIFARELNAELASLVSKIDKFVADNKDDRAAAFVVLLTEDPDAAEGQLQAFAEEHSIKNVPLTVFDGSAGPPKYKIAKESDVTVLMWRKKNVMVNHAFEKGKLNTRTIASVVGSTSTILAPAKETKAKAKAKP